MLKSLIKFFLKIRKFFRKPDLPDNRLYPKDVEVGDMVYIEWDRVENGIGCFKCLSNDIKTKKLLLFIKFSNTDDQYELIVPYDSPKLQNFNLLHNRTKTVTINNEDEENVITLLKEKNNALSVEDYEKANKIQGKIDEIIKG